MWTRRYHGPDSTGWDEATALALDNNGNVYVTGRSCVSGTDYDYATIKYDSSGDTMWVRKYNGPGNGEDCATGIRVDNSENVYVTGYSDGFSASYRQDYVTIKYNSVGNEEWVQRYDGPNNEEDWAYAIVVDNKGYVYVTGMSSGLSSYECATIKYSCVGIEAEKSNIKNQNAKIEIFPNPFVKKTVVSVQWSVTSEKEKRIEIYDISGKLVKCFSIKNIQLPVTKITLDLNNISNGIYFLKLEEENNIKVVKKLIKIKGGTR